VSRAARRKLLSIGWTIARSAIRRDQTSEQKDNRQADRADSGPIAASTRGKSFASAEQDARKPKTQKQTRPDKPGV